MTLEQQFQRAKREAIEAIEKLEFSNHSHFIIMIGNHDEYDKIQFACCDWQKEVGEFLVRDSRFSPLPEN